jgi:preprotein translocase subunit SecD
MRRMTFRLQRLAFLGFMLVVAATCSNSASRSKPAVLTFAIQCTTCTPEAPGDGPYRFYAASSGEATVYLEPGKFDGQPARIVRATSDNDEPALSVYLQPDDARRFEEFTARNVDRPLVILVDDKVLSVATINEPLPGSLHLVDRFTPSELDELVRKLSP